MTEPSDQDDKPYIDVLRAAMVDARGLAALPKPAPLVDGILFRDSLCWIYGPPGCCKSFVALDIAGCVGTGERWQGHTVHKGIVLYLVAEGASGIYQRIQAWEASMGIEMTGVIFLPMPVQSASAREWDAFIEAAAELGPVLIIIDTQARVTVGLEENSAMEMGRFVNQLERLRAATQAAILTLHHTGRGGEHMRGSIAIDGAAHTVIKVNKADDLVELECDKQKDAVEFDKIKLRLVAYPPSAVLYGSELTSNSTLDSPAVIKLRQSWWEFHESEWVSAKVLLSTTETSPTTFYRVIKALVRAHFVETKGDGSAKRFRLIQDPTLP